MGKTAKLPKRTCCVSKSRCDRCPIRMLKEGTLPPGYGVHKRALVRLEESGRPVLAKKAKKSGKGAAKISKQELVKALRKQKKSARKAA